MFTILCKLRTGERFQEGRIFCANLSMREGLALALRKPLVLDKNPLLAAYTSLLVFVSHPPLLRVC